MCLSSFVVGANLTGLWSEVLDQVVGQLPGQGVEDLLLVFGHVELPLGLCLVLVDQQTGILDLHDQKALLPPQHLECLLDLPLGHELLIVAVHLHIIRPVPVGLRHLVPLLGGGVARVIQVGGVALGRAVLEGEGVTTLGLWGTAAHLGR